MSGLQLITSNPVVDEYDRRTQFANQQATQDLQNRAAQQNIDYNTQANPIKLRDITSTADINAATARVAGATTGDKIAQSGSEAENAGLTTRYNRDTIGSREQQAADTARESGANADVAVGTVQPKIALAGSQAQEGAANAQLAQGTLAPKIAQAQTDAATSAANAQVATATVPAKIAEATSQQQLTAAQAEVAKNGAQYDKEGRFMDLWAKNPQAALTQAQAYGVPPDLVAALQDQTKADWIGKAWASIVAQYPGDLNAALRASIFEQKIKEAGSAPGGVPSPSAASQIPAGSPPPMTQRDLLIQNAQLMGMKPGSAAYVNYISSNGTKLPAGQVVTGDAAKALNLDPSASWQQDASGAWKRLDTATVDQRNYQAAIADGSFKGPFNDFLKQRTNRSQSNLEARATAAGLQEGTPDYQAFMLSNGQVGDPTTVDSTAQMIAHYKMAPLTGYALRTAWGQKVLAAVNAANPTYNATVYGQRQKAARDFGTGQQGNTVRFLNVAISHLNVLDKLGAALQNGDVRLINQWTQHYQQEFGTPAPTSFDAAKQIVADEVIKAVVGAGGAQADRESAQQTISRANSFPQLQGVMQTYRRLLAGQMVGLKHQYETSTGLDDFSNMLLPETAQELEGISPQDAGTSTAATVSPPPPVPSDLPQGTKSAGKTKDGRNAWRLPDGSLVAE